MEFPFLVAVVAGLAAACSAPDPGFVGPATRTHAGSTSGGSGSSSSSSGGSGASGAGGSGAAGDAGSSTTGGGGADGGASVASKTFGSPCAGNIDCGQVYDQCQTIQNQMICTKACAADTDCPSPPTVGTCNTNGYCK